MICHIQDVSTNKVLACFTWHSIAWPQILPCDKHMQLIVIIRLIKGHLLCPISVQSVWGWLAYWKYNQMLQYTWWLNFCLWRVLQWWKLFASWLRCVEHVWHHGNRCAYGAVLLIIAWQMLVIRDVTTHFNLPSSGLPFSFWFCMWFVSVGSTYRGVFSQHWFPHLLFFSNHTALHLFTLFCKVIAIAWGDFTN